MTSSRLFEIIYILLEKKKVTAPELAERFEVSVRTIYRDIDALSSAGIPVYCTITTRALSTKPPRCVSCTLKRLPSWLISVPRFYTRLVWYMETPLRR